MSNLSNIGFEVQDEEVFDVLNFDKASPNIGGVIQGQFWLSGHLLAQPEFEKTKRTLLGKLFGN